MREGISDGTGLACRLLSIMSEDASGRDGRGASSAASGGKLAAKGTVCTLLSRHMRIHRDLGWPFSRRGRRGQSPLRE